MENEEIKAKLKEIQDIVADLQEPVKTIATQELVAKMLGTKQNNLSQESKKPVSKVRQSKETSNKANAVQEDEEKDKEMIGKINRTTHEVIHKLKKNIDKALYVLKIMKDEGYDGLNPSQINFILSEVFRVKSNVPAISMALINDKAYTSKLSVIYKGSKANEYKIMQAGIDYIEKAVTEINQKKNREEEQENEE